MTKEKSKPPTPAEVQQVLGAQAFDKAHKNFVDAMEDQHGPRDWQYDALTRKWYLDDGEMYDGDEQGRKFVLVEIQSGAGPGFNPFPCLGYLLFLKGTRVASDVNAERLKKLAIEMLDG